MRVLLVDDDQEMLDGVAQGFRLAWADCTVLTALDGQSGLRAFVSFAPDIVLLDLHMPNLNGFELLREIRRVSDVPVVMLSSRPTEDSHIRGLDLGADDYIPKPFSMPTLVARVRALLRRVAAQRAPSGDPLLAFRDLTIDANTQQVWLRGQQVQLTRAEFRLLHELAWNRHRVVSNGELRERVWGSNWQATANDLKALVYRVRVKLQERSGQARFIRNQRGIGYRFVAQPLAPGSATSAEACGMQT